MTNVTYTQNRPYASPVQAQARVKLIGPSGVKFKTRVLVDTGATYAQFPIAIANAIGRNANNTTIIQTSVTLANGSTITLSRYLKIQLEIEGIPCYADVIFDQNSYAEGILGLDTMLQAIRVGFDPTDWLWRKK